MNRYLARGILIAVLALAAAVAIGLGAYNAGVAQGIAESGRAVAALPPGATPVYLWPYRGFGFGFFPFFVLLFLFFVLRGVIWRRQRWYGWGGGWGPGCGYYRGVPPAPYFDEWHRRAHEQQPPQPPSGTTV